MVLFPAPAGPSMAITSFEGTGRLWFTRPGSWD